MQEFLEASMKIWFLPTFSHIKGIQARYADAFALYVWESLGSYYSESPPWSIEELFNDSDKKTPVISVLSQGADPTIQLIRFAEAKIYQEKFRYISLGQGQELHASRLIETGKINGDWVLLPKLSLI